MNHKLETTGRDSVTKKLIFKPFKFENDPAAKVLRKYTEKMAEDCARIQDRWVRDALLHGNGVSIANPTRWFLFKLAVKRKIKSWRISLAEWIGGDDLHEHCNYD